MQVKKNRFLGIILKVSLFFLTLLFLSSIIISIPSVQTYIINKVTDSVFEKINHKVDIGYINIRWFDTVLMRDVEIYDTKNQEMVKVDRIILDFKLGELITKNSINFDKAILQAPAVDMIKNSPDDQFNFSYFIQAIRESFSSGEGGARNPKAFHTDKIVVTDGKYRMYRPDKEIITERFDQYHFTVENLNASLEDFLIIRDTVGFQVNELQCVDSATGLDIKNLKTKFLNTWQSLVFQNMEIEVGNSSISQSMIFKFEQPSALSEFVDSVEITTNIKQSVIYSKDLGQFVPSLKKYDEYYKLTGYLEGPVSRFDAKDIILEFGKRSRLEGYISMYGLPLINETFINVKLSDANIAVEDITPYINNDTYKSIKKFEHFQFNGRFSGFPGDFVSNASFDTRLGSFETDINLKIDKENNQQSTYSGHLITQDFNLGAFLEDTASFQYMDMDGKINGHGLTAQTAQFTLVSEIKKIGIKNYNYQKIKTDATLANQFFNGNLSINDPNLDFTGNVSLDLRKGQEFVKIEANLGLANLQTLNISDKEAFLSSSLNVDMHGLKLDNILGNIFLNNTYFEYDKKAITIDTLKITSERDSLSRSLMIESSNFRLHMFGDFNYSAFFKDVGEIFKEYSLIFENDSKKIKKYYADKKKDYSDYYYLDYEVNIKDINPFMNLFIKNFYLSPGTDMFGSFTGGPTKQIEIYSDFDKLSFYDNEFNKNTINISTSKSSDDPLVYAKYFFESVNQTFYNGARTKDLNTNVEWQGNKIDFSLNIAQSSLDSYANVSGNLTFLSDETILRLDPSEISALDRTWSFSEDNVIKLRDQEYEVQKLLLSYEDQSIEFNGKLSKNPYDNLFISVKNFHMENINPLIDKELGGIVNGYVDVKNFFSEREINSRINIKDFTFEKFLVGNIISFSEYDNLKNMFDVNFSVQQHDRETMVIEGNLMPASDDDQLNLTARFTDTNLNILEPFFEDYVSDVGGNIKGDMTITGRFTDPVIKGEGHVGNGEFTLDYLNTHYGFNGNLVFDNNSIGFKNFTLLDHNNNKGKIRGEITHKGFKDMKYDFYGNMRKFMVLNTTSKENELYYGTAFASGDLHIFGQENNFTINAKATSEKGTKIYIPLEGSVEVVQEDFITFVNKNDTTEAEKTSKDINLSGLNLNFDFDITTDAYCEIIFDLTAGDIIRGRGNGKINMQIDTHGDFNMFGKYEIQEGGYNFTLYNIINKEFQIVPNSKITWIGDPYGAILDIQAEYRQLASLAPILHVTDEEVKAKPELNRKYPALVLLDIKGNLMHPEINFDIAIDDYPKSEVYNGISLETQIAAFRNKIANDEQEMKRQVFSLIILKNFSPENAFNVGGSVERSVSEFISNQISYWVTQFDENLEVDVDLGSLNDEAFNTFQLRMSYSFLDGRLRVTRDGGFTNPYSNSNVASILGDWSVEYLLTKDGKLRAKIYNKTNFNSINPNLKSTSTTAGFSLMHTQSFDELNSVFKKAREDSQNRKKNNEEEDKTEDKRMNKEGISKEDEEEYIKYQE